MAKKARRDTQKARAKPYRAHGGIRSGEASPKTHVKSQIESLQKLAKTQGFTRKDYVNVFMLAKDIQAKNASFDKTNLRKKMIGKGGKEGSKRETAKSGRHQETRSRK